MKAASSRVENFAGALAAGLPAPLVFFVAASVFEHSPVGEIAGGLVVGSIYLAFAQFWVAPRRPVPLAAAWVTVLGALVSLAACLLLVGLLENPRALWQLGLPCLAAGLAAGWLGAWVARRLTAPGTGDGPLGPARRTLHLTGLALLLASGLVLLFCVVPVVLAGFAPGFNTSANVVLFRVTAAFELVGVAALSAALRNFAAPTPKTLLGPIALGTLLLGLIHLGMGALCWRYSTLLPAAFLLWGCAAANFTTTFLVSLDSVLDDRRQVPAASPSIGGAPGPAGKSSPGVLCH